MTAFGPYAATVSGTHDGDTLYVDVLLAKSGKVHTPLDLGFNIWRTPRGYELRRQSVRLVGINAPELKTPAGKVAAAYVNQLVKVGDTVTLTSFGWDKFGGRIDGKIVLADGRDLAAEMVKSGNALPWDGKGVKP